MVRRWKRVMAFLIAIIFCINCVMNIGVKGIYAENSNKDSNTEEVHTSAEEKEDATGIEKETTSKAEKNKSDGDLSVDKNEKTTNKTEDDESKTKAVNNTILDWDTYKSKTTLVTVDDTNKRIYVKTGEALTLLSNCSAENYKDYIISLDSSVTGGAIEIPFTYDGYEFKGLGTKECPFEGNFNIANIKIQSTLFAGLSSKAVLPSPMNLQIQNSENSQWNGENIIFADYYVSEISNNVKSIEITLSGTVPGSLFGKITGNGALKLNIDYTNTSITGAITVGSEQNIGLICNTLTSGTLDVTGVTFPTSYSVTSNGTETSAGGIVGKMCKGSKLVINNFPSTVSVTTTGADNAGGIVGYLQNATVEVKGNGNDNNNKTLKSTITKNDKNDSVGNAGGLIGKAEQPTFSLEDGVTLTVQTECTAEGENSNAGGLFGYLLADNEFSFKGNIKTTSSIIKASAGNAGGLVGMLINSSEDKTTTVGKSNDESVYSVDTSLSGKNVGGLFGCYSQKNATAALTIKNATVSSTVVDTSINFGGLIGKTYNIDGFNSHGYIYATDNVTTSVNLNGKTIRSLGGVLGENSDGYFLNICNYKGGFDTTDNCTNVGGLVGNMDSGVLRLSGITDLSEATITNTGNTKGQLVGKRNNALIYAVGDGNSFTSAENSWMFKRSAATRVSDIGSYGEVYRPVQKTFTIEGTEGLLNFDSTNHSVTVASPNNSISSVKDYAAIAIRAQMTAGGALNFGENPYDFSNQSLSISNDIDLTGTGITGFMRDNGEGDEFKGSLDGNNHSIILSIGEAYGVRENTPVTDKEGSGRIYGHDYIGLFAKTNNATINNLTIKGSISFADPTDVNNSYCGAVVAQNVGANVTVKDCTVNVAITYGGEYYVGGLIGQVNSKDADTGMITSTNNSISGSIQQDSATGSAQNNAFIGGVISSISRSDSKLTVSPKEFKLDITGTKIKGLNIKSGAKSNMGGFLGYQWDNTAVTFSNVGVSGSSLASNGDANWGGLVYKATGYWKVCNSSETDSYGIKIQNTNFEGNASSGNKPDGLLVYTGCHSASSALYLEIQKNAYVLDNTVTVNEKNKLKFDELVGMSFDGTANGQAVISIATSDAEEGNHRFNQNNCTTYHNVTKNNNSNWQPNDNTRYYYNLDIIRTATSKVIEEELLLWSVRRYAADNIKSYFETDNRGESITLEKDANYDMTGYSFYPVSVGDENLSFNGNGATIKFANKEFDDIEQTKEGATTVMKTSENSQHSLMQFGLFRNFAASSNKELKTYQLEISNIVLTGTIGSNTNSSGALLCENISGAINGDGTTINTHSLVMSNITLNNLYITGFDNNYATLLVRKVDSYSTVALNNISATYKKSENTMPEYAASCLIGDVGGASAQNISMSFSSIALQDGAKKDEKAMFSKAMLLHSFQYPNGASCAAVYNFNLDDDWVKDSWDHHNATYGRELSKSVEYKDLERCYYDTLRSGENIYVNNTNKNNSTTKVDFENYLPYVFEKSSENNTYHEIKVNVYVADILNGCGTYGHPFQIDSAAEMIAIANYIKDGTAGNGWKIRICENFLNGTDELHSDNETEKCLEYISDGTNWKTSDGTKSQSVSNIREYMRNAYYQITKDITLGDNFCGFGYSSSTAFRGVIVGKIKENGEYPTIKLLNSSLVSENASHGLINNSFGSVVMNLNICLSNNQDEGRNAITITEDKISEATVNNYFGGVIGQVLGGDNIIDKVNVTTDVDSNNPLINVTGEYNYLVPIGAYIGIVQGGCVITRNISQTTGFSDKEISVSNAKYNVADENGKYFYINPYVGRVLDGCVFYEQAGNTEKKELNNTNKNYKIPTINSSASRDDIKTNIDSISNNNNKTGRALMTTTVKNAQALLILSAIANSGAGSGGHTNRSNDDGKGSYAYYGNDTGIFGNRDYGKVRNASYLYIGNSENANATSDFSLAANDDHKLATNRLEKNQTGIPYLITKYTDKSTLTYFYCGWYTRAGLNLDTGDFNMTKYQSGYRGIGGRYKSASIQTGIDEKTGKAIYNADRSTPFTSNFDGNNKKLTLNTIVKEYYNDNYNAIGVGGVFNVLQQDGNSNELTNEIKNISISGTVQLEYYNKEGTSYIETIDSKHLSVGVGGIAGRIGNRDKGDRTENAYADVKYVTLNELNILAPANAGGIIGIGGFSGYVVDGLKHSNSSSNNFAAHFTYCSLSNVTIQSSNNAGGYIGWLAANVKTDTAGTTNTNNQVTSCKANTVTIQKNTNEKTDCGGVFYGKCDSSLTVKNCDIQNATVNASNAGALVAKVRDNSAVARKLEISDSYISNSSFIGTIAGGLVGISGVETNISNIGVDSNNITAITEGGLLGEQQKVTDIYGTKVSGNSFEKEESTTDEIKAGGLIGEQKAEITGGNLLWDTNTYNQNIAVKGTWVGMSNAKIKLAGVSRSNTQTYMPLNDVGNSENTYEGYISYGDYTVQNNVTATKTSGQLPENEIPTTKFSTDKKLSMYVGEKTYLGDGSWSVSSSSDGITINNANILSANSVGQYTIHNGENTYTINVINKNTLVETEFKTIMEGATYDGAGKVKYNGNILESFSTSKGTIAQDGTYNTSNGSMLKFPVQNGKTYRITYGALTNNDINPGRMHLVIKNGNPASGDSSNRRYMSAYDKDAWDSGSKISAYQMFMGNSIEVTPTEDGYIWLNYAYKYGSGDSTYAKNTKNYVYTINGINYTFNQTFVNNYFNGVTGYHAITYGTDADKNVFSTLKIEEKPQGSERIDNYDQLMVTDCNNNTIEKGESNDLIEKMGLTFAKFDSNRGVMLPIEDTGKIIFSTKGLDFAGEHNVKFTYDNLSCTVNVLTKGRENENKVNVINSPTGQFDSKKPFNGDFGTLYGDAVYNYKLEDTSPLQSNVELILNEIKNNSVATNSNRVLYTTTNATNFKIENKISTYKRQMDNKTFDSDFRVLLVNGTSDSITKDITDYLNIITNGGYSSAVENESVDVVSQNYKFESGKFIINNDAKKYSLRISKGSKSISYYMGNDYDNGKDQFTLLTVTFKSGNHSYAVYVPMVVRRIVQIDFSATLSEESIFTSSAYDNLKSHVLVDYDSYMTGYLTWTYDQSQGENVVFDWQSYMEAGADLTAGFGKTVQFDFLTNEYLPTGTKLTLIDTMNQDKMYSYDITAEDIKKDKTFSIALSNFTDENNNSYKEKAISVLYGARATTDSNGKFVKAQEGEKATVITTDGKKYRLKSGEEDESKDTYSITLENQGNAVDENFYLIVNVPKNKAEAAKIEGINGAIKTIVNTEAAPCSVLQVHRYDNHTIDNGLSTESTFSILSAYTQELVDQSSDYVKKLRTSSETAYVDTDRQVNIKLLDKISFNSNQAYGDDDKLYQEFLITPYSGGVMESFLDDATSVNVSFSVYSQNSADKRTYYSYDNANNKLIQSNSSAIACSYNVQTTQDRLKLVMGTENSEDAAIDLSEIRKAIVRETGSKICIEAEIKMTLSDISISKLVPSSKLVSGNPQAFMNFQFVSRLSKSKTTFNESSWRVSSDGTGKYYRDNTGYVDMSFSGDDKQQLGINLNNLPYSGPQTIEGTVAIDFRQMDGWESIIKNAKEIQFSFELKQKQDTKEYIKLDAPSSHIAGLEVGVLNSLTEEYNYSSIYENWSWIQKNNSGFKNMQEGIFRLPVRWKVKVDSERDTFYYANYRLVVNVSLIDQDGNIIEFSVADNDKNIRQTGVLTDFVTYTVARIVVE